MKVSAWGGVEHGGVTLSVLSHPRVPALPPLGYRSHGMLPAAGEAPQNPAQHIPPLIPHPTVGVGGSPLNPPRTPHPLGAAGVAWLPLPRAGGRGEGPSRAEPSQARGGASGAQLTGAPRLVPPPPPVPDQGERCCVPHRHQRREQGPGVLHEGHGTGSAPAGLRGSGTNQRPPPRGSARSALTPPEPRPGDASCPPHRRGPPVSHPAPPGVSPSYPGFLYPGTTRPGGASPPSPPSGSFPQPPAVSPTRYDLHGRAGCGQVRAGAGHRCGARSEGAARLRRWRRGLGGGGQGAGADINNRGPSPSPS